MTKTNTERLTNLRSFLKDWDEFNSKLNEEFGKEIWSRLRLTIQSYRLELNCLEGLERRDSAYDNIS